MAYVRYDDVATEFQGESFGRTLTKRDGSIWETEEEANYIMIDDSDGTEIDTGDLTKSTDNSGLIIQVSKTVTAALLGNYTILVYLTRTDDVDFGDVIAKYELQYTDKLGNSS